MLAKETLAALKDTLIEVMNDVQDMADEYPKRDARVELTQLDCGIKWLFEAFPQLSDEGLAEDAILVSQKMNLPDLQRPVWQGPVIDGTVENKGESLTPK